ncbi:DUF221-domain-containing protein [Ramaria rubella]|nr:DUF221-domain-containing protein [Ramaria rubella]
MSTFFFNRTEPPWEGAPPGSPPTRKFEGPWFTTQLVLSGALGLFSFLVFSYCRKRWPVQFAPRTKLKGFSPHEAHARQAFFGWILPTIRTSEFTILQIVGLDAAVLLNFFKMSFYLFSVCSVLALVVLMPINVRNNIGAIEDSDPENNQTYVAPPVTTPQPSQDWLDLISEANSYLSVHLVFTYLFTILTLRFIHKNYTKFIRSRQLFSLELVHSIAARTVLVTDLPNHLQGEHALAVYFENMDFSVESVSVVREPGSLEELLDKRTRALLKLETAWVKYVGNPSSVESYDPSLNVRSDTANGLLIDTGDGGESQPNRLVVPHRSRPTLRPHWFSFKKVDAIDYLQNAFQELDDKVRKKRRTKFKATPAAFVTFEKMSSAQIVSQVVHAPYHSQAITHLAPEPRDIIWANMTHSRASIRAREVLVLGIMGVLLFFWVFPVTALASLLSYEEIKKVAPWLGRIIDSSDQIKAIVQNSLPSVAMISLNAFLPFILEFLTYQQGYRARSWIEYSLLRKYFLFLLINVVFIFLLASTYWQLVRDLANSPAKVPERLAIALQQGRARHFFLSYVILQGFGIMPLQLLNLGVVIPAMFHRAFITRTPRDFAELNAPPMINYGTVYPQAILVFVVTLLYSVIQPLIVFFGAAYFGIAYVVYKYKLLFVFYKPYESHGQAWPITCHRLLWGVIMFQVFMTGIFTLNQSYILSSLMTPLILCTLYWGWSMDRAFQPLSEFVSLSSAFEVQRGEDSDDVVRLRAGHPVTLSQSNLSRRRYAQNDETLYVAPEDDRTDYSQPPMHGWYPGVLNTGKRRYGHPALTGVLPQPWLPIKKGQSLANSVDRDGSSRSGRGDQAVVLTLRKRYSAIRRDIRDLATKSQTAVSTTWGSPGAGPSEPPVTPERGGVPPPRSKSSDDVSTLTDPWRNHGDSEREDRSTAGPGRPLARHAQTQPQPLHHRLSFDHATGVIMLPEDGEWLLQDDDSDSEGGTSRESVHRDGAGAEANGGGAEVGPVGGAGDAAVGAGGGGARYRTYYHHPERRRTVPGAFPQASPQASPQS